MRDNVTEIRWEVDDGYAGKSRPHSTYIPNDELAECETEEELQDLVDEYVSNDFEQLITWYLKNGYPKLEEVKDD